MVIGFILIPNIGTVSLDLTIYIFLHTILYSWADVEALQEYISGSNKLEVILWLGSEAPPRTLLMALIEAGVSCSLIR